jgi:nitrite reductase/ring-hydroxylating ferredoxin subunit
MPREASDAPRFKVAEVDELPPGKGKTATVLGREITVFNDEGRLVATASAQPKLGGLGLETTCLSPGHHFDTGHPALSPDRLRIDEIRYQVQVDDGSVYVVVEGAP